MKKVLAMILTLSMLLALAAGQQNQPLLQPQVSRQKEIRPVHRIPLQKTKRLPHLRSEPLMPTRTH